MALLFVRVYLLLHNNCKILSRFCKFNGSTINEMGRKYMKCTWYECDNRDLF